MVKAIGKVALVLNTVSMKHPSQALNSNLTRSISHRLAASCRYKIGHK